MTNPRTMLPQPLVYVQPNHTNQEELDSLLMQIKLKFWLPLQHVRYEKISQQARPSADANDCQQNRISFCIGFQCPKTDQVKLVRFYQELMEDRPRSGMLQSNFRPYFPNKYRLEENISYFSAPLRQLLCYNEDFNRQNPLVRILRLASFDISDLEQDPSLFRFGQSY